MGGTTTNKARSRLGRGQLAIELLRPLLLFGAFGVVSAIWWWPWSVPLAFAAVLAASLLVHDLIHNALRLPRTANSVLLGAYALLLIKSGHALRRLHFEHHRICLEDEDLEGSPIYMPVFKLLVLGPWLAIEARIKSWQAESSKRWQQGIETLLNVVIVAALIAAFWWWGHPAPLVYLCSVAIVSVTVPITGAKLPHLLPAEHPWVQWAVRMTTRLTPAASSLLLHELHHRRPRIPAALLAANRDLLDTTEPSNCAETYEQKTRDE